MGGGLWWRLRVTLVLRFGLSQSERKTNCLVVVVVYAINVLLMYCVLVISVLCFVVNAQ